jgi:hypothetical protein
LYYFLAGVGSLSILALLLFLCVEKSLKGSVLLRSLWFRTY